MDRKKRAEERHEEEDDGQGDGHIEQRPLQATAAARHAGATTKDTAARLALYLKENNDDECDGDDNLNDIEIELHSRNPFEENGRIIASPDAFRKF
jgi:hypothetical protein